MNTLCGAVIFFEEETAALPLALETLQGRPVLSWMAERLRRDGVRRVFLAASPRDAEACRACFPAGTEVTVSDRHEELMHFLSAVETVELSEAEGGGSLSPPGDAARRVAVLPRAAVPVKQAGAGFAYAAPPESLREIWRVKMTNAVQDAELLSGWIPLYGPDTLAEIAPLFRSEDAF